MPRLLPPLYYRHRGFWLVMMGLFWIHLWAALDDFLPHAHARHDAPGWAVHNALAPFAVWGSAHTLMVVLIIIGLYFTKDSLFLVRVVCALSASIFTLIMFVFIIAAIEGWPHVAMLGTGLAGLAIFSAIAALLEPGVNPANERGTEAERAQPPSGVDGD